MRTHLQVISKSIFALLLLLVSMKITAQPTITSFAPAAGPVGTPVTITGTNFNVVPANNIVFFGDVKATVIAATATSLSVTTPIGANYMPISVLNISTGLTAYSMKPFIVTFPNPFGSGIPANYYKPTVDFTCEKEVNFVAIGDLDGDGKPDMVVCNSYNTNLSIFRNTSTTGTINASSFAPRVDIITDGGSYTVAIGDLDGDGKPDLAVSSGPGTTLYILKNISSPGSITASSFEPAVKFSTGNNPVSVAIGDVDGDGKPDVVTANANFIEPESSSISVFRNTSTQGIINTSSFAVRVDFKTIYQSTYAVLGDLDDDGKVDITIGNRNSYSLSVMRNTSTKGIINGSSFATPADFTAGNVPISVAIGDLDKDNKIDLVATNQGGNSKTISVLRNTSTPGTINAASFSAKVDLTCGSSPVSSAIGDLDGDAKPDIVVVGGALFSVLRNTSTPGIIDASSFANKVDFAVNNNCVHVAIGDLDGDGIPEILVPNSHSLLSIFQIDLSVAPVNLTDVKAYQQNKGVKIEWTAQQESNIEKYEIERSQNGQQFYKVGIVQAKGNSSVELHYNFFDATPFTGASFYRIKIVEADHSTYSQILKVSTTNSDENKLIVYPNPILDKAISFQMNLPKGFYQMTLTNNQGQQLMSKKIDHAGGVATERLDLSNALAAGVYQLRLAGENINITRQVISK